jgi:hypothetical protein
MMIRWSENVSLYRSDVGDRKTAYGKSGDCLLRATTERYGKWNIFVRLLRIPQHARATDIVIEEGQPGVIYLFQFGDVHGQKYLRICNATTPKWQLKTSLNSRGVVR